MKVHCNKSHMCGDINCPHYTSHEITSINYSTDGKIVTITCDESSPCDIVNCNAKCVEIGKTL